MATPLGHFGWNRTDDFAQVLSVAGSFCIVCTKCVRVFYWGNFLADCTDALFLGVVTEYAADISHPIIKIFSRYLLSVTFWLEFVITYLSQSLYRWENETALELIRSCIVIVVMYACPDSGTWISIKGKGKLAASTFIGLRGA